MKDLFLGGKDGLYGAFHTYVGEEAIAVGVIERAERRRLHRQHPPRPRPPDRQGRRSEQDVGRDLLQGDRLQQGLRRVDAHHRHVQGHHGHERHRRRQLLHGGGRGDAVDGAAAPSRWRSRSSATARSASPYYFSAIRSCANLKVPYIFVNENNLPVHARADGVHGADQVHLGIHQGSRHPALPGRRQRCLGGATRPTQGSRRVGARRQGPEHDRRHHLPLVRPRRLRRRQGRPGRRDGPALPHRRGSAQWMSRDPIPRYKKWLLAKGTRHRSRADEDREADTQAAVDASVEFARKSARPGRRRPGS